MQTSVYKKVGIASVIMMGSVFLSGIVGLVREMTIAYAGGAGSEVDAYQMAFILPELLNHVAATGFLSITFIPIFNRYLIADKETEAWRVFSIIFTVFGFFLLVLLLAGCVLAPALVRGVAPGLKDPKTFTLAVRMTRIVLPAQFFFFAGGLMMAVQFAKERFLIPALAPLIYNIGIILGGLILGPRLGIQGFAWGVVAGAGIGNFVVQWIGARQVGMRFIMHLDIFHPALRQYLFLTLPLMLGLTMTFSTEFFFRFFGSYMPKGTIAALNYGLRIMFIFVAFFGRAVGTASYPFMSRLVAEGRLGEMNALLNRILRYLALVIPFSVLFMVLHHEVVLILFQRGKFDAGATELTGRLLPFLMAGAFAFAAQTVVVRGYYAMQDTLFPAVFCTLAVLASIPFYLLGMKWLGPRGVALGISFSALLQVIILYALWNRRTKNPGARPVYRHVVKIILLSGIVGVVLEGFQRTVLAGIGQNTLQGAFAVFMIEGLLFLAILTAAGRVLQITELQEFFRLTVIKINGMFKK